MALVLVEARRRPLYSSVVQCFTRKLHASIPSFMPRRRPGTRMPLPEEEVQRRVHDICYRYRKQPKSQDEQLDSMFPIGNHHVSDEEIQSLYREYVRLYYPYLYDDDKQDSMKEDSCNKGSDEKERGKRSKD